MSAGFALLCIVAVVVPLGIVWILYGPAPGGRVTRVAPAVPDYVVPRGSGATYQPEAVFAVENHYQIAKAAQVAHVVHTPPMRRASSPPPVPSRTRMARGSAPPAFREQTVPEGNPFVDESATYVG